MPSPATVLTSISSAIATLTGGSRLWRDLASTDKAIPAGGLRFQIKSIVSAIARNSNDSRPRLGISVSVHRRLSAGEAERTYTEGARLTHQQSLVDPQWWRAISGVHDIALAAETSLSDLVRDTDRNVISYTVTLAVVCVTP